MGLKSNKKTVNRSFKGRTLRIATNFGRGSGLKRLVEAANLFFVQRNGKGLFRRAVGRRGKGGIIRRNRIRAKVFLKRE